MQSLMSVTSTSPYDPIYETFGPLLGPSFGLCMYLLNDMVISSKPSVHLVKESVMCNVNEQESQTLTENLEETKPELLNAAHKENPMKPMCFCLAAGHGGWPKEINSYLEQVANILKEAINNKAKLQIKQNTIIVSKLQTSRSDRSVISNTSGNHYRTRTSYFRNRI